MLPSLAQVLALPAVERGRPAVRAGADRLDEPVRWVHVSEVSWIASLLEGGELILTTGIALPRAQRDLRRYIRELAEVGVSGVAVELGRRYRELPAGLVDAALEADLPLIELHRETRFVSVTQQVHTLILDARMRELTEADERHGHRALLTLLTVTDSPLPDAAARSAALGVLLDGRAVGALVARRTDDGVSGALLRELGTRAADVCDTLRLPALVGAVDEHRLAVLVTADNPARVEPAVRRITQQLHAVADRRRDAVLSVGVGAPVTGPALVQSALREARRVADTAAVLAPHRGWFRASDVRLHGLVHELRDTAQVRDFVARELDPVVAWDREHGSDLLGFLTAFCAHGGNKTATAAELFISRAALYDRISRTGRVLDADLSDPQVLLSLHVALLSRAAIERPGAAVRAVD